jgi:hypothetical protein
LKPPTALAISLATEGFSVIMRDLGMGQESNSGGGSLQVRAVCLRGQQRGKFLA